MPVCRSWKCPPLPKNLCHCARLTIFRRMIASCLIPRAGLSSPLFGIYCCCQNTSSLSQRTESKRSTKLLSFTPRPSDLETRDIGAIVPSLNRAATFQRRCGVIGSHEATDEHGETFTRTFVDPLAYLRSGRRGVLIVDPKQASAFLAGKRTIPSDDGVVEKENAD